MQLWMDIMTSVSVGDFARHVHSGAPAFAEKMRQGKDYDSEYADEGVYVSGCWSTTATLSKDTPFPGAVISVSTRFFNHRPENFFSFPVSPEFLTCRVKLTETLEADRLTSAQKNYIWHTTFPFALNWSQCSDCKWAQRGHVEVIQYIQGPAEGSTGLMADMAAKLTALCSEAQMMAKKFQSLGNTPSPPRSLEIHESIVKRQKSFIKHKEDLAEGEKRGSVSDYSEDPILENNAVLAEAVFKRPWVKVESTDDRFSDTCRLIFYSISYSGVATTGMADLIISKASESPDALEVSFDIYDYLEKGKTYKDTIKWFKGHTSAITDGGTKIGESSLLDRLKAIYTYAVLRRDDPIPFTARLGIFREQSYQLQNQFYSKNRGLNC